MELKAPLTEDKIRNLRVGDVVELTGTIYTGRDAVHKYLHDGGASPVDLKDQVIYHCGPVVVQEDGEYVVKAAGPTTSAREEPYQGDIIRKFGIRAVIGKGGMGEKTLAACQECGAVYLHAIGGSAQVLARAIKKVTDVHMKDEFGAPEAIWVLEVENFPCIVTMDAHGESLHRQVLSESEARLRETLDAL